MRGGPACHQNMIMNESDRLLVPWRSGEQRPTALTLAHVVLWAQAMLFTVTWVGPNIVMLLVMASVRIRLDGDLLFVPLFLPGPFMMLSVASLVLTWKFARGRRRVRTGIILMETLLLVVGLLLARSLLENESFVGLALDGVGLCSVVFLLAVVLGKRGRDYFGCTRSERSEAAGGRPGEEVLP